MASANTRGCLCLTTKLPPIPLLSLQVAANFVQAVAGGNAHEPVVPTGGGAGPAAPAEVAEELQEGTDGMLLLAALRTADDNGDVDGDGVPTAVRAADRALEELVRQRFTTLIMHEVGHTLGLRHNFRASSTVPFAKLADAAWVAANGMSASVMDYLPGKPMRGGVKRGAVTVVWSRGSVS